MPASPSAFLELLQAVPSRRDVFNPWRDDDWRNEGRCDAAAIRARQLVAYLAARVRKARVLLVAEAVGYQGAKFSGVPLTSERILLDHLPDVPARCAFGAPGLQTSIAARHPKGVTEPTSTITWRQLLALGYAPEEFVFWNAFPFHPHRPGERLSNRKPTRDELARTAHVLRAMRALFPKARLVAVGGVARKALGDVQVGVMHVRHPANGGAALFKQQLEALRPARREAPARL